MDKLTGAGGTPGGIPMFLIGFAMAVAGGYLLTSQVTVTTGFWTFFGQHTFGLSLLPFIVGVLMLFMDGRSKPGCLLLLAGGRSLEPSITPCSHWRKRDGVGCWCAVSS